MQKTILVINAGSSSLKMELFEWKNLRSLGQQKFEEIGSGKTAHAIALKRGIRKFLKEKRLRHLREVAAIGHRVVHGGEKYAKPVIATNQVIKDVKHFALLAPLHNPANLACILACKKLFPKVKQVACFDTAFHRTMPEKAFLYALPLALYRKFGIRRYGFHGLSHAYVMEEARRKLGRTQTKRMITCHLGNGCSLTAVLNGKSVDTTMGFTPLEGIPMGTRSGDIDPSIILYLLEKGWNTKKIEHMLNHESGLKGLSGIASDVRTLLSKMQRGSRAEKRAAKLAFEIFCYRAAKAISALTASLGGLDCLVFTAGIGEHAPSLRKKIIHQLPFKNFTTLIIPTDEEKYIAKLTKAVMISA